MADYDGVAYGEYNKLYRLRVNYHVAQDMINAISTITMYLYVETTDKNRQYNNYGTSYWNMTGTEDNYIKFDISASQTELYLGSSSIQVTHDSVGNGGFNLNAYWYSGRKNSNYIPEAVSMSAYIGLQNIPRKSSISISTAIIGQETSITITGFSDEFTHGVYCYFGSQVETIRTEGKRGTFKWTVPESFYSQIPNSASGQATLRCETKLNGNIIGTSDTIFTIGTDEAVCKPDLRATINVDDVLSVALTGDYSKIIKGVSDVKVIATPTPKNSATITSVTVNGVVATSGSGFDGTGYMANFQKAMVNEFEVIAKDSRGYSTKLPLSLEMIPYIPVSINATFFRPEPTTGEVQLTLSGNFFEEDFGKVVNILGVYWKYKEKSAEEWSEEQQLFPTIEDNKIKEDTISLGTEFDYRKDYEFNITAMDEITMATRTTIVTRGLPVYSWGEDYFNVYEKAYFQSKVDGVNLPVSEALELGTYDDVGDGEPLQKTGLFTTARAETNIWYHLMNLRHRNGNGDGPNYGWQLRKQFAPNSTIQSRTQNDGEWSDWEDILRAKVLYDSSGTTGNITLSESAENFSYIEIFFYNRYSQCSSVKVRSPHGKTALLSTFHVFGGSSGTVVAMSRNVNINGNQLYTGDDDQYGEWWSYGNSVKKENNIYITTVIGYR